MQHLKKLKTKIRKRINTYLNYSLAFVTVLIFSIEVSSQNLFVTDIEGVPQKLCLFDPSSYGGVRTVENYSLLATLLGDNPNTQLTAGQTLIAPRSVSIGNTSVTIQPFVYTASGSNRMRNLPAGTNLKRFLADPLNGEEFDLTLPFSDDRVALSDRSAFIRISNDSSDSDYHTAIDFDRNDDTTKTFDVVAPADGIIQNSLNSGTIAIIHKTSKGKEFLTVYAHLNPDSKRHITDGAQIKRGEKIGVLQDKDGNGDPIYTHLHFSVAVKGPSGTIGGIQVPEMWYLIDPFGVYDYRQNRFSDVLYNYLPNNNITRVVRGVRNAFVFQTNPIGNSFFKSGGLEIGESKTRTIRAKEPYNYTDIYIRKGQKYKFTTTSPEWNNGSRETTANGYNGGPLDAARRHPDLKVMALTGEIFNKNNDALSYTGTYFRIGTSRTWKATKSGYLVAFANDCLPCYGDNSRVVTLKVKRIE